MQRLDLNVAPRPFRNNTLLWAGYGLAVALLVTATAWSVTRYRELNEDLADLRAQVSQIETQRERLALRAGKAQAGIGKHDLAALTVQANKANEVIARKAFSWTKLFNRLAEIQPWDLRMTTIRPVFRSDADTRAQYKSARVDRVPVLVEAVAKNFGTFREFQQALQNDPHFGRVTPERGKRTDSGEWLVRLTFEYFPEAVPSAGQVVAREVADASAAAPGIAEDAEPPDEERDEAAAEVPAARDPQADPGFAAEPGDDGTGGPDAVDEAAQDAPRGPVATPQPARPTPARGEVREEDTDRPERPARPTRKRPGRGKRR